MSVRRSDGASWSDRLGRIIDTGEDVCRGVKVVVAVVPCMGLGQGITSNVSSLEGVVSREGEIILLGCMGWYGMVRYVAVFG